MGNNIIINFPKKISSILDYDLETNFQIFKLQVVPESAMSFTLKKIFLEDYIPTVQFYNYLADALLMNGYYLAAENVLLYANIFLKISDNIEDFNNVGQTINNKFINLIFAKNNNSIFDFIKNTLNINTTILREYFKVFKINLKKGRNCPFISFSDFYLSDSQLKKFLENDIYLTFNFNNIFKNKFKKRLENLFYDEIKILDLDNNNFYKDITIVIPLKLRSFYNEDGTPNNKAYSLLADGMFSDSLNECLKYMVNPQFIPTITFYNFLAKILTLNGYFCDAMNVLLYTIIGALNNPKFRYSKSIKTSYELYKKIYDTNSQFYPKIELLKILFEFSKTKNSNLFSVFSSSDSKYKVLNFIKQDDGKYIFFKKKNTIFNYKETLVTDEIYFYISSGKIYNNENNCPICKNLLINNTIKKIDNISMYQKQIVNKNEDYKINATKSSFKTLITLLVTIFLFLMITKFFY